MVLIQRPPAPYCGAPEAQPPSLPDIMLLLGTCRQRLRSSPEYAHFWAVVSSPVTHALLRGAGNLAVRAVGSAIRGVGPTATAALVGTALAVASSAAGAASCAAASMANAALTLGPGSVPLGSLERVCPRCRCRLCVPLTAQRGSAFACGACGYVMPV